MDKQPYALALLGRFDLVSLGRGGCFLPLVDVNAKSKSRLCLRYRSEVFLYVAALRLGRFAWLKAPKGVMIEYSHGLKAGEGFEKKRLFRGSRVEYGLFTRRHSF